MLAIAGLGVLAPVGHAADAAVTVGQGGDRFTPNQVSIQAGEKVNWTWASGGHNVQVDAASDRFDSGYKSSGGTYSHAFSTPGTYEFYCSPHRGDGMRGTVTVTAAPAPPPPPPGSGGSTTKPPGTGPGTGTGAGTSAGGSSGTTSPASAASTSDVTAPLVALVRTTFRRRTAVLRVRLSEASTVHVGLRRRGARKAIARRFTGRQGLNTLRVSSRGLRRGRYRVRVVAIDAAGNRSRARTRTLVVRR